MATLRRQDCSAVWCRTWSRNVLTVRVCFAQSNLLELPIFVFVFASSFVCFLRLFVSVLVACHNIFFTHVAIYVVIFNAGTHNHRTVYSFNENSVLVNASYARKAAASARKRRWRRRRIKQYQHNLTALNAFTVYSQNFFTVQDRPVA